jgi:hypothetical protein
MALDRMEIRKKSPTSKNGICIDTSDCGQAAALRPPAG